MLLVCFVAVPVVAFSLRSMRGPWQVLSYSIVLNLVGLLSIDWLGNQSGLGPSESVFATIGGFVFLGPLGCVFQYVFNNLLRAEAPAPDSTHKLTPEEVVMDEEVEEESKVGEEPEYVLGN